MTWKAPSSFALSFTLLTAGCADLSPIEQNVCGNKVTEPINAEECDGESDCFEPGGELACRYRCITGDEGERSCREPGYRCGLDDVCRAPSGKYELVAELSGSPTVGLSSTDFDGDGRLDVLRESGLESFVQYYGDRFETEAVERIIRQPNQVSPLLQPLNDDDTDDVAFSVESPQGSGLVVYRTGSDGALEPTIYATIPVPLPASPVMTATGVMGNFVTDDPHEEVIGFISSGPLAQIVGVDDSVLTPLAAPDSLSPADLVGIAVGDLDPALPCDEVVYAQGFGGMPTGDPSSFNKLWIVRPCDATGNFGDEPPIVLSLPDGFIFFNLDNPPEAPPDLGPDDDILSPVQMQSAVQVVDITGDGLDDILVIAASLNQGGGAFIAIQDPVLGFPSQLVPMDVSITPFCQLGALLGFGDFDGDGMMDLVNAAGIARLADLEVTVDGMGQPLVRVELESLECLTGGGWGRAVVRDFDANGTIDIVATRTSELFAGDSISGLDIRRGDGTGLFTAASISTSRPVRLLDAGDFDGDSVQDIVYVEADTVAVDRPGTLANDDVKVAFGKSFGGFEEPQTIGQIRLARSLATGRYLTQDAADDIAIAGRPDHRKLAFAPIIGNGARQMVAPYLFLTDPMSNAPRINSIAALAKGQFHADSGVNGFAAVTTDGDDDDTVTRLWRVASSGAQAELTTTRPDDSELECFRSTDTSLTECVFAAADLDGDAIDELVVFETHYSNKGEDLFDVTALSLIHVFEVDESEDGFRRRGSSISVDVPLTFSPRHFNGPLAAPAVRDFDGDGTKDIAIIANSHELFAVASYFIPDLYEHVPGTLVVFWNDQSGSLSTSSMSQLQTDVHQILGITPIQNDADPELELVVAIEELYGVGAFEGEPDNPTDPGGAGRAGPSEALRNDSRLIDFAGRQVPLLADAPLVTIEGDYSAIRPRSAVSGDFDGDGVDDIVTGNNLGYLILRGIPVQP